MSTSRAAIKGVFQHCQIHFFYRGEWLVDPARFGWFVTARAARKRLREVRKSTGSVHASIRDLPARIVASVVIVEDCPREGEQ